MCRINKQRRSQSPKPRHRVDTVRSRTLALARALHRFQINSQLERHAIVGARAHEQTSFTPPSPRSPQARRDNRALIIKHAMRRSSSCLRIVGCRARAHGIAALALSLRTRRRRRRSQLAPFTAHVQQPQRQQQSQSTYRCAFATAVGAKSLQRRRRRRRALVCARARTHRNA